MSRLWRIGEEAVGVSAREAAGRPNGYTVTLGERTIDVSARASAGGALLIEMPDGRRVVAMVSADPERPQSRWITVGDRTVVVHEAEFDAAGGDATPDRLEAPMPGKVLSVSVAPGDSVQAGDVLLVVEAMKMEHTVRAPVDGTVREVKAAAGDMVSPGVPLVTFESTT